MAFIRQLTKDVKIHNELKVFKGYTLFAPQFGTDVWLIDMEGNVCHHWKMKYPPGVHGKLLASGNLMWLGRGPEAIETMNGSASELLEVDWEGNEIWRYDDPGLNHDFQCLKNGNILVLRFIEIPEKLRNKVKGGVPGTELPKGKILGVQIREINRNKETLWEWNYHDHFNSEKDVDCPICTRSIWGYTNSIDAFPNGDPIISVRRMNKVIRISRKTGEIIWEWGPENLLGHQHDVSVLKNGNITIFDNGVHRKSNGPDDPMEISCFNTSRVVEVNPKSNEIVWEYIDPMHQMFSQFCGSAQRLPNGNTLICESVRGTFYEVTNDKEVVWKYVSPFITQKPETWGWTEAKTIFQAHRYSIDFEGFKGRDLDSERFEWVHREKSKKTIEEEDKIKSRLSKAGY